jgi:hypothetical protein
VTLAAHLVLALVAVVLAVGGFASGASAGGWAVTTLDETPVPAAGEPMDVSFTIRQHGVTPVDMDNVAIIVASADGSTSVFPAAGTGRTGHYVATVTFPDAGPAKWFVRQGAFGEQELGAVTVSPPSAAVAASARTSTADAASTASVAPVPAASSTGATVTTTTTSYRFPWILRVGLPVLAVLLAGAALADAVSGRPRRQRTVATH